MRHGLRQPGIVRAMKRSRVRRALIVVGLAAATVLLGVRLFSEARQNNSISEEIARLEQEATALSEHNAQIESLIGGLAGSNFAEREARLKLGLRKPGEKVIVIEAETEAGKTESIASPSAGNPARWWYYFFERERLAALAEKP